LETIPSPSKDSLSGHDESLTLAAAVQRLLELDDEPARQEWIAQCVARFPPDHLLPFLVSESERLLNADPYGKLRIAESLIAASELTGRPDFHALGLMATGDAYRVLGRYQDSVNAMDEAGRLFLSIDDEVGWARTRIGWVWSSHNLGRGEVALAEVGRAHDILVRHENWFKAATLDLHTGWVCYELGRYNQALTDFKHARELFESCGATAEMQVAWTKINTATVLTQLGDFHLALQLYEEARQILARHDEWITVLRQEQNVANVYAAQGLYTRALRQYTATFVAYEEAHLDNDAAIVALRMVECSLRLNRLAEALALAEETAQRFEGLGTPTDAAKARFYYAIATARLGDTEQALSILAELATVFDATGLRTELALAIMQRATLHLDAEDWTVAREEAEQAGTLFRERGLVIRAAQADLVRARAACALNDNETAMRLAQSALTVSRDLEVLWLAHEAHHILGNVAQTRGDFPAALDAYDQAMRSIEGIQSALAVELRTNFLADKLGVYEDAIAVSLHLARPEKAFTYLERAKSRALVDYLASNLEIHIRARDGANQELLDLLARLREEHNGLYNRLYGYGFSQQEESGSRRTNNEALRSAIQGRETQIARVLERLALDRSEGLAAPGLVDRGQPLLPRLDSGAVLLEYFFRHDGGVVFVRSPQGLIVTELDVRPREIRRLLNQWSLNLDTTARAIASNGPLEGLGRNARGILAALYRALIAPIASHLIGCERLIVVPYGPTHTIPFHALFDGECYLLETREVSVCPSSNVLRLCIEQPRNAEKSALVVAHSDGGRLPAVLAEARAVSSLLPGECFTEAAATRSAVIAAAPRHRILHLAAHGEARIDNPTFAHLKLADGQLSMIDIFNLGLRGALVTLSACESGRSVVTGGDELVGLSRGFLYAGTSTLIQSLWRVEDGSTAELMARFYRALGGGQSKGAALREAQLALLGSKGVHPFYWAPFQLIGDSGPL
jgi:CHAT domain-containing protein